MNNEKYERLLIDGNSTFYRAFFATQRQKLYYGEQSIEGAVAFIGTIRKVIKYFNPDEVLVAFDKGKNTWRHKLYSDYKAGRRQTPDELFSQMKIAKEYLDICNIPYLESDEYEADDIIGSIGSWPLRKTAILSSDKDMLQLVDDEITVFSQHTGEIDLDKYDIDGVITKLGIHPNKVIDYKGIVGDKSDNLKGINGIGEKTAVKLLNDYGSLEKIYDHLDNLSPSIKKKFIEGKKDGEFSKKLATITRNAKLDYKFKNYSIDSKEVSDFYKKYNIKKFN